MLKFTKIVATGNDFLFVDARKSLPDDFAKLSRAEMAKKVCDRNFGVGADGLVFVEPGTNGAELRWDFYNNDGSHAEMCGNASRCMGRWAERVMGLSSVNFETTAGQVQAAVDGAEISSHIDYLKLEFKQIEFEIGGRVERATFVNTGVPHAVYQTGALVADLKKAREAHELIGALRFHPDVGPRGTNVTFVERADEKLNTVTFERGVEDFTLSCGTGVLAAAAVSLQASGEKSATLTTPGGTLEVQFGEGWVGAILKGPAQFLFDVVLDQEFFR